MADNIELNSGSGGATLAADDITSVWYQRIKLTDGTADSTTAIVAGNGAAANALRVTLANDSTGVVSVSELPAAAAMADNTANPTTTIVGNANLVFDGATWDRLRGDSANGMLVNLGANNDVTVSSSALPTGAATETTLATVETNTDYGTITGGGTETGALRVTIANNSTGLVSVDDNGATLSVDDGGGALTVDGSVTADLGANNDVQGATAHDAAVSGNPFLLAGEARTTTPTAVANGDVVRLQADDQGRLITEPHAPRDLTVHNRITLTTTTETTLIAAGGAGVFHDLVFLSFSNESATEVRVDIADATAGTDRISMDLAADGGGVVIPFPVPLTQATANNNWTATLSAAVSTVYITAIAVKRA